MFSDTSNPSAPDSALLPAQQQTLNQANRLLEGNKPLTPQAGRVAFPPATVSIVVHPP
jgi:hypothetical protein